MPSDPEADLIGRNAHILGLYFPARAMVGLEHARRKLPHLARSGTDDEVTFFIQPDAARATDADADSIRRSVTRKIQIVFKMSRASIEHRIDAWV